LFTGLGVGANPAIIKSNEVLVYGTSYLRYPGRNKIGNLMHLKPGKIK